MDSSYSAPHPLHLPQFCGEMSNDHVLNMSPRPSQHLNHSSSSSSAELVKEIATLEGKIVNLERRLLSLYQQHFRDNNESHVQQMNGIYSWTPPEKEPGHLFEKYGFSLVGETKSGYSRHPGDSGIDEALVFPDKLSEDMITCISSIYCKLAKPERAHKGNSVLSSSSFCSSSTLSPRNLSGSWSPQCSDEVAEVCASEGRRPSSAMVEVTGICLNDETYKYTATMLQKLRALVKSLKIVDLTKTRREQKLAFWINIHNALVMHSYLAYGTRNYVKRTTTLKATYNVGGHSVNAYDIQRYILGIKPHYSATWPRTLLSSGKKLKAESIKHAYGIEYPEPLVHFALSSGTYSDPAVRVYSAKNVFEDLKVAREEFVGAMVRVHHKQRKVNLPKILQYYAKDMLFGIDALLEVVGECLTRTQREAFVKFVNGRPEKCVYWLEQSLSFRFLIHKDVTQRRLIA